MDIDKNNDFQLNKFLKNANDIIQYVSRKINQGQILEIQSTISECLKILSDLLYSYYNLNSQQYTKIFKFIISKIYKKIVLLFEYNNIQANQILLKTVKNALKLYKAQKFPLQYAMLYDFIGIYYRQISQFNLSYKYHQKSLQIKTQFNLKQSLAESYINLKHTFLMIGQLYFAVEYAKIASNLINQRFESRKFDYHFNRHVQAKKLVNQYLNIAIIYKSMNLQQKSKQYLKLAMQFAQKNVGQSKVFMIQLKQLYASNLEKFKQIQKIYRGSHKQFERRTKKSANAFGKLTQKQSAFQNSKQELNKNEADSNRSNSLFSLPHRKPRKTFVDIFKSLIQTDENSEDKKSFFKNIQNNQSKLFEPTQTNINSNFLEKQINKQRSNLKQQTIFKRNKKHKQKYFNVNQLKKNSRKFSIFKINKAKEFVYEKNLVFGQREVNFCIKAGENQHLYEVQIEQQKFINKIYITQQQFKTVMQNNNAETFVVCFNQFIINLEKRYLRLMNLSYLNEQQKIIKIQKFWKNCLLRKNKKQNILQYSQYILLLKQFPFLASIILVQGQFKAYIQSLNCKVKIFKNHSQQNLNQDWITQQLKKIQLELKPLLTYPPNKLIVIQTWFRKILAKKLYKQLKRTLLFQFRYLILHCQNQKVLISYLLFENKNELFLESLSSKRKPFKHLCNINEANILQNGLANSIQPNFQTFQLKIVQPTQNSQIKNEYQIKITQIVFEPINDCQNNQKLENQNNTLDFQKEVNQQQEYINQYVIFINQDNIHQRNDIQFNNADIVEGIYNLMQQFITNNQQRAKSQIRHQFKNNQITLRIDQKFIKFILTTSINQDYYIYQNLDVIELLQNVLNPSQNILKLIYVKYVDKKSNMFIWISKTHMLFQYLNYKSFQYIINQKYDGYILENFLMQIQNNNIVINQTSKKIQCKYLTISQFLMIVYKQKNIYYIRNSLNKFLNNYKWKLQIVNPKNPEDKYETWNLVFSEDQHQIKQLKQRLQKLASFLIKINPHKRSFQLDIQNYQDIKKIKI